MIEWMAFGVENFNFKALTICSKMTRWGTVKWQFSRASPAPRGQMRMVSWTFPQLIREVYQMGLMTFTQYSWFRPHPKWWFSRGNPGKFQGNLYYSIWPAYKHLFYSGIAIETAQLQKHIPRCKWTKWWRPRRQKQLTCGYRVGPFSGISNTICRNLEALDGLGPQPWIFHIQGTDCVWNCQDLHLNSANPFFLATKFFQAHSLD